MQLHRFIIATYAIKKQLNAPKNTMDFLFLIQILIFFVCFTNGI